MKRKHTHTRIELKNRHLNRVPGFTAAAQNIGPTTATSHRIQIWEVSRANSHVRESDRCETMAAHAYNVETRISIGLRTQGISLQNRRRRGKNTHHARKMDVLDEIAFEPKLRGFGAVSACHVCRIARCSKWHNPTARCSFNQIAHRVSYSPKVVVD